MGRKLSSPVASRESSPSPVAESKTKKSVHPCADAGPQCENGWVNSSVGLGFQVAGQELWRKWRPSTTTYLPGGGATESLSLSSVGNTMCCGRTLFPLIRSRMSRAARAPI